MTDNKIYIIAEMACSHDGSLEKALKIIDGAGDAGADAIQLQIISLEHVLTPTHPAYQGTLKILINQEQWRKMVDYSRKKYPKMDIWVCVFEHKSVDFIETLGIDGYKINSSDLSNPYVLDRIAATGKKVDLSVGASTLEEIKKAVQRMKEKSAGPMTLMYGIQSFPTCIADIHLNHMMEISKELKMAIGYQDHCDGGTQAGFWIPALAAGMGAVILEKHITHDRSLKGVDHESALNPDEFKTFVQMVHQLETARGIAGSRPFSEAELKYRKFQKKSIVASRPLPKGDRLKLTDVSFLRSDQLGMPPDQLDKILDKIIEQDIPVHQIILEENVS